MSDDEGTNEEETVLLLNAKDVNTTLNKIPIQNFIQNQSETFQTFSSSEQDDQQTNWQSPLRTLIKTENCAHLFMPSSFNQKTTIKCVSVPQNAKTSKGLPAIGLLFDENNLGKTKVIINVDQLTAVRTASGCLAASIAMQPCRRSDGDGGSIVIFGKGNQAKWHARLFVKYYKLEKVVFVIRNWDEVKGEEKKILLSDLKESSSVLHTEIVQQGSFEMNQALNQANFICCCTPSTKPLFDWDQVQLKHDVHFSLIGSYQAHMQEVPVEVVQRACRENALTVDSLEACKKEAGDLLKSKTNPNNWIEIGKFIKTSPSNGNRDCSNQFSLFKSVGFALQDNAIINLVSQYAIENKVGTKFDFF